jgi:hypothetical protein
MKSLLLLISDIRYDFLHGRFSVATGGASIISLLNASEKAPYQACLLIIKDSIGYSKRDGNSYASPS